MVMTVESRRGFKNAQLRIIGFFGLAREIDTGNIDFTFIRFMFAGMITLELRSLLSGKKTATAIQGQ